MVAPHRWLPLVLAVVVPLGLLALAWTVLSAPVVAGPDPLRERIDAALARRPPEVVVLGASKVATDLDLDALAGAFGVPPDRVQAVAERSSTLALWYALLENRVYRAGLRPARVVVYATLDELVSVEVPAAGRASFLAQLGDDEPVLTRKVFGGRAPTGPSARARDRAEATRAGLTGTLRDGVVGAFLAPPAPSGLTERGRRHAEPALERLFGPGQGSEATRRVLPVVEEARPGRFAAAADLAGTLVPDLLARVGEHGGALVVVRAPVRSDVEPAHAVDPALAAAVVAALEAGGARWIDLATPPRADAEFGDPTHLNPLGRRRVSRELAARLSRTATAAAPGTPVDPAPPAATRSGTPPTLGLGPLAPAGPCAFEARLVDAPPVDDASLVAAGLGPVSPLRLVVAGRVLTPHTPRAEIPGACRGVGVHDGERVLFSPPPGVRGDLVVEVDPAAPLLAPGAPPAWWVYPGTTLSFAAQGHATLAAFAFGGAGGVPSFGDQPLLGAGPFRSGTADGPVRVSSPADGPWLYLQRLEVDGVRLVGGRGAASVGLASATAGYAGPAPVVPLPPPREGSDGVSFALTGGVLPSPAQVEAATGVSECTPLRPAEAGRLLPLPVGRGRADRIVVQPERLLVRGARGGGPWSVVLADDRRCRGGRWLYPGDRLALSWPAALLARLPADPDAFALSGALFGPGPVRVRAGEAPPVELDGEALAEGHPALVGRAARWPGPLRVEIEAPADTWVFLVDAAWLAR